LDSKLKEKQIERKRKVEKRNMKMWRRGKKGNVEKRNEEKGVV
jgi:hypothetical protein